MQCVDLETKVFRFPKLQLPYWTFTFFLLLFNTDYEKNIKSFERAFENYSKPMPD